MDRFSSHVVVITGATSGIGLACAERFAREGAAVVLVGRRRERGDEAAKEIGDQATFIAADVTQEDDIRSLFRGVLDRFGRIDCVINNAGSVSNTTSIPGTSASDFDQDLALHVRATFLTMKYASPAMMERGAGCFINMSSISGHRAGFNTFGYEVAKAAVEHLTRCAALELGECGVRVNAISPGPTLTGIFGKHVGDEAHAAEARLDEVERLFTSFLPAVQAVRGMIHAEDIASAAAFLASDEARFVNGHNLVVDGGISAGRPASVMMAGWQAISDALRSPQPAHAQAGSPAQLAVRQQAPA